SDAGCACRSSGEAILRCCVVLLLLLTAIPAWAQQRPRDAVMAGAYRCSAIRAGRQGLYFFYGAPQPARSQLGLPPAPQGQLQLSQSPPASEATPRIAMAR